MNPSKSFSIEQSYINLSIVNKELSYEKERHLRNINQGNGTVMNAFEQIYGMETTIDIKDIFKRCQYQEKQILIYGLAGIGKSTFCQYIAYRWAVDSYWPQYELLVLIHLRYLTGNQYPPLPLGQSYSLIDLVKRQLFPYDLSESDEKFLKERFNPSKTLWILDGYDEIVQNVPSHLECLLQQLLKTENHILTSRSYMNTLSYDVQMEITGFTDKNIEEYMKQFFNQMKNEVDNISVKSDELFAFLRSNPSVWCVAHIPLNLELICSVWIDKDRSEIEKLTVTKLYDMMVEWICRRHLKAQNISTLNLRKKELYQCCQKELTFLETLAFNAMAINTIIIQPTLLEKTLDETNISLRKHQHILNIGFLKTMNRHGIGTQIETSKDHYFIHPSFQEFFAARYLITLLKESSNQQAIEFIEFQKYNQRFQSVFAFASGLFNESDARLCTNIFWNALFDKSLDLVGIRYMQFIISCIEENKTRSTNPRYTELLEWIVKCIKHNIVTKNTKNKIVLKHISQSLQRAQSVTCHPMLMDELSNLLCSDDKDIKITIFTFIATLNISNPSSALITTVANALDDDREDVRQNACIALGNLSQRVGTNDMMISKILNLLEDGNGYVRLRACQVLWKIDEKIFKDKVINKLVNLLGDKDANVRRRTCQILGQIGEKIATNEVINKLVSLLQDENIYVTRRARQTLERIGKKGATDEVVGKLMTVLGDKNEYVRENACEVLWKIGKVISTDEMISKLVSGLEDNNENVRENAWAVLWKMGEKAATNEVIVKLLRAFKNENKYVRQNAWAVLWEMNRNTVANEKINKFESALVNENDIVEEDVCIILWKIRNKTVTNEMTSKVVTMLEYENAYVRASACITLGQIGVKEAMSEVINKLVDTLSDKNEYVRDTVCVALREIGIRISTDKVVSKLVNVLSDDNSYVRAGACIVLENIGEKAATDEVISKLLDTLADNIENVKWNACKALGKMGEKGATNEVIRKLMTMANNGNYYASDLAWEAIENLLSSSNVTIRLSPRLIIDLCMSERGSDCLKSVSIDEFIENFFTTKSSEWLSALTPFMLLRGAAVTVLKDKLVIYSEEEPLERYAQSLQLLEQLTEAFTDQAKQLYLFRG